MVLEEFLKEAEEKYGQQYDFSYATEQGVENNTNIPVRCNRHGIFYTTPYMLLHGMFGCFECHKEKYWRQKDEREP